MKASSNLFSIFSFLLILFSLNSMAFRQADTHMHGEAELNIAIEAQVVQIEFISPAMNLAGFEHTAKTEKETQRIKTIVDYLNQARWLQLKPQCTLQNSSADLHQDEGEDHSEFTARYQYLCQSSQALESINLSIFSDYPGIHEIDVNLITTDKQISTELSHEQSLLKIK